jgi:hypothetical protein
MPTMKIRGGDLDPVVCEVTSFPSGTNLKMLDSKKEEAAGKNIYFNDLKV